jgi:hypothetical protein
LGYLSGNWLQISINEVLATIEARTAVACSLPHTEIRSQWSLNDF